MQHDLLVYLKYLSTFEVNLQKSIFALIWLTDLVLA